jgi:hypothetical protein
VVADNITRAALARLENENRAVRQQLDLVLSSKARRLLLMAAHPLWSVRAAAARLFYLKPVAATRELWREFRAHRTSLSSVAPGTSSTAQWSRELGISGEVHEALLCDAGSRFTFTAPAGPGSRFRVRCALLPRDWETKSARVEFKVIVRARSGVERSASRVLNPSVRWSDRRWRSRWPTSSWRTMRCPMPSTVPFWIAFLTTVVLLCSALFTGWSGRRRLRGRQARQPLGHL